MSAIKRFFVEKRKGLDSESEALFHDIRESLDISLVEGVRLLHRYDLEGVSDELLKAVKQTVISEPPVDVLYEEAFPLADDEVFFVTEYLPGQFDQCADSLVQCVEIISGGSLGAVNAACAKVFVLKGALSGDELEKIKAHCHNPVDSRIGCADKPETLAATAFEPPDVAVLEGFINMSDAEMTKYGKDNGFAMSAADLIFCRNYFKDDERRNPTVAELKVIDTYWSDHCRHTTFLTELTDIKIEGGFYEKPIKAAFDEYMAARGELGRSEKPVTLMDIAVAGMRILRKKGFLDDLDVSEEINACSVEIDVDGETWLLMFKNETHNHPTEIEPFGGAATCLGGAIRDPLSGRAYVYQAMRITGAGNPLTPVSDTIPGKLPQRKITREAARGYSSYGNQIGLATGHVREIYDDGFVAKRMEIGAVVGAVPKKNVVRETPSAGDVVIMVGGRTGRDGCGGATGSSKSHGEGSLSECGAEVQKGNAPTERKLQRLFANENAARLIKKCNDFGAGGVCVAIGELAPSISIELDRVLKKYEGLDGTELAISESQERMAVVVSETDAKTFIDEAKNENLEAVAVAKIADDGYLRMFSGGREIVSLKREFLDTNGASQYAKVTVKELPKLEITSSCEAFTGDLKSSFAGVMKDLNACSQKGLVEMFDATIGAGTVLMPFGGKYQLTPEDVMAAKIPAAVFGRGETNVASVMSAAYDPAVFKKSTFHGGVYSVLESVARLAAAGCDYKKIRLSFQEYFEKLTDEYSWGKPTAALLGAFCAQSRLCVPAIGGKDSMSGTFLDMKVPPVLASFAVCAEDAAKIRSCAFSESAGSFIYIVEAEYDEYELPRFSEITAKYDGLYKLSQKTEIVAAAAVKKFGVAEAVAKMCFGNMKGFDFDAAYIKSRGNAYLFKPLYGSVIFESKEKLDFDGAVLLGKTNNSGNITVNQETISVVELLSEWQKPLEKVFPTKYTAENTDKNTLLSHSAKADYRRVKLGGAKPCVFMPVFPGTNCEFDTRLAFERAGASVETFVFKNTAEGDIAKSVEAMAAGIKRSQIIMLPGGFSAGDEPNGSAKFIAAVFRNPKITEAVMEHLKLRDGLILGICNGFQALVKTGLLPFGEIAPQNEGSATIYYNKIGRHVSQIVKTRVVSNKSPFLAAYAAGDVMNVAVSHGEGRFLVNEETFDRLNKNGQIATVYCDFDGETAYEAPHNPNGARYAIEGVISPCGKILGRMGHPERAASHTFKNIEGKFDTQIFDSAVKYFG